MMKHNRKEKLDTSVCSKHDSLSSGHSTVFIVIKEYVSQCHDAAHMFLCKFIAHRIMNILMHINNVGKKKKSRFVFCFLTNTLTADFKYPIYVNVCLKPFLHLNHSYPASRS